MSRRLKSALIAVAAFVGMGMITNITADDDRPPFKITTRRDTFKVGIAFEKRTTVIAVRSPVEISQAVIGRMNEMWPAAVFRCLNSKGLESFRASNGNITLNAAVSSQNNKQRVWHWRNGDEESLLDRKSPLWMEIRLVGGDGKTTYTIPLKNGYFEMQLPKAFFVGNPKSITAKWIDIYRN